MLRARRATGLSAGLQVKGWNGSRVENVGMVVVVVVGGREVVLVGDTWAPVVGGGSE